MNLPEFIDLSNQPRTSQPRNDRRLFESGSIQIERGLRVHEELYGGTADALRLHALPSAVVIDFPSSLYELCRSEREQAAVERLLARLEQDLRGNELDAVDAILARLDVEKLAPAVLVAALAITVTAKTELPARADFLHRSETALRNRLGADRANALLALRR